MFPDRGSRFPIGLSSARILARGWYCSGVFTRAEAAAASIVAFLATAIVSSYLSDAIGFALHPTAILLVSIVGSTTPLVLSRKAHHEGAWTAPDRIDLLSFTTIVAAVLTWLLSLAWLHLLPIGGGADLAHHLMLIYSIDPT